ncbi:DNA-formamidopyrimidine glycosylase [Ahniella affigens]|uniref:Formamidopyrimidine-DNA glycosylase n=1 Tax=Ahniella affigens TaxID=2021234 RepID=A0A2P1PXJ2_9GAMM|nr:bifunctional DNA-formamidopyrimidine glycosylase/DNA-(apurinic or apyrimidinic site) lyase [Ahniella affigens]AVP99559.1 DNA-formamidopyrimidine glycosylase [Ahniella affigens]
MPELPEVETTRRGIAPHLKAQQIDALTLRRPDLRWPIPKALATAVRGQQILGVRRRAKYLLIDTEPGAMLIHLGMSGSLRVLPHGQTAGKHDHYDLELSNHTLLRFNDPRRFGCLLWQAAGTTHELLAHLGPEPLEGDFDGDYLFAMSRGRSAPIKAFLMDQAVVVGVGNIYVAEALFAAGIRPMRAAGKVSRASYQAIAVAIRRILAYAIERGGTTLRDFLKPDGEPGYFEQELFVYGRAGEPCKVCGGIIKGLVQSNRASSYCPRCQK